MLPDCAPDVVYGPSIDALLQGLASQNKHTFYIGTSGAALTWGQPTGHFAERVWDDIQDLDAIRSQPDSATHAVTDRIVRSANTELLHTAIVSPPYVTGLSSSKTHPAPLTFPDIFHVIKTLGAGVTVAEGTNRTTFVHVRELAKLYVSLVENALGRLAKPSDDDYKTPESGEEEKEEEPVHGGDGDVAVWGPEAYYFAANLEISFHDLMGDILLPAIKKHEKGEPSILKSSSEIKQVPIQTVVDAVLGRLGGVDGAELWSSHIADGFGVNMRIRGTRAEKALGITWQGGDAGLEEAVAGFLDRD